MRGRRSLAASLAGLVVLVAAAGCGGGGEPHASTTTAASPRAFEGTRIPLDTTAADFALTDEDGKVVRLSDQRGRLVLMSFLYTSCRDVCPLIATHLDSLVRSLGKQARSVRVLAVTVDPDGDTPAVARAYVK